MSLTLEEIHGEALNLPNESFPVPMVDLGGSLKVPVRLALGTKLPE